MLRGYEVSLDDKNVDKIMRWPFLLTSWIMSINSASVGFCPKDRMTVPSSLVVMVPEKRNKNKGLTSVSRRTNPPSESHAKNATSTVLTNVAFPKKNQRSACRKRIIPCTRDNRQHFSRHCRLNSSNWRGSHFLVTRYGAPTTDRATMLQGSLQPKLHSVIV